MIRPGLVGFSLFARGHGGEERTLEQYGKGCAVERIGQHKGSVTEKPHELRRTRVQNPVRVGIGLPANAAKLDDRNFERIRQQTDVRRKQCGGMDEITENIRAVRRGFGRGRRR